MLRNITVALLLLSVMVFGAACGSVATPVWEAEDNPEVVAEAAEEEATEEATEEPEPTAVPPTATTEPTAVPPTAVPPTATTEPTEEVVEEVADEGETIASAIAAGDPENGMAVFNASLTTSVGPWMCASCHNADESAMRLVGPSLWDLYARAEESAAESGDESAVAYVRNSIIAPTDYIVEADPEYPAELMPPNYGEVLTEQELADVIAYILTLGNPDA